MRRYINFWNGMDLEQKIKSSKEVAVKTNSLYNMAETASIIFAGASVAYLGSVIYQYLK